MAFNWAHEGCEREDCTGTTECPPFPTTQDRISTAQAVFDEYSEAEDTPFLDFLQDVCLLALSLGVSADTIRQTVEKARAEYAREGAV
jgi:hypothetical protein